MTDQQATHPGGGLPRRVRVTGGPDIDAAVVVTVVQGAVWMSITPPFTGHAVMQPRKVDEVIRTLQAARGEAEMTPTPGHTPGEGTTVVREITKGSGAR